MVKRIGEKVYNFFNVIDKSQALVLLFTEIVAGVFLSFISVYIFLIFSNNTLNNNYLQFDSTILNFFFEARNPLLTRLMFFITFLGNINPIILFSFIFVMFLNKRKHRHEALLFLFILISGFILNNALKLFIARERPILDPVIVEAFYSYPSGHSMNSFIFYAVIAFLVYRFTKNKKLAIALSLFFSSLILLIGISRIYLGVHYPTDVIAGFIGGFFWVVTVILLEKTIVFYRLFRFTKSIPLE